MGLNNTSLPLKEMTAGTVLWNLTEYICYLCIIINTGLTLLGMLKGGIPIAGGDPGLGTALGLLNKVVDQFNDTSNRPDRPLRQGRK